MKPTAERLLWMYETMLVIRRYEERLAAARRAGAIPERLTAFRWLLEELRVSLFAQELRTPMPVCTKRVALVSCVSYVEPPDWWTTYVRLWKPYW